jgi:hypothetical protein
MNVLVANNIKDLNPFIFTESSSDSSSTNRYSENKGRKARKMDQKTKEKDTSN